MDPSCSEPTKPCYTPTPTKNMPTKRRPLMPNPLQYLLLPRRLAKSPSSSFQLPRKILTTPKIFAKFHQSQSGRAFLGFIVSLKISDPCPESHPRDSRNHEPMGGPDSAASKKWKSSIQKLHHWCSRYCPKISMTDAVQQRQYVRHSREVLRR